MAWNQLAKEFILITSENFPDGGASANYLNLFCKGLKYNNQKISVRLLKGFAFGKHTSSHLRKNLTRDNIPFIYLSSTQRSRNYIKKLIDDIIAILRLIIFLLGLIKKRKTAFLLVYNNALLFNIPIYLIGRIIGLKIISFVTEYYDKSSFKGSLLNKIKWCNFFINFKYLNRFSFKLIVFSSYLKEIYINQKVNKNNIIIQPNLTDFEYWKIDKSTTIYTLGYSGTPSLKDGLNDLLQAISVLRKKNLDITLLVIGDNTFGESLLPNLRNLCETLDIYDLVTFTGLVELAEVKQYLSECMILTLTRPNNIQTQTGFPTKLGEYFASGKRILVTDFGDIEKYFIRNKDLVMAKCGDVKDIADKIQWVINNQDEAKTITENGYSKAMIMLDYKSAVFNILKFLED